MHPACKLLLFIYQCRYPTDHPLRPQRTSERKIRHLNLHPNLYESARNSRPGLLWENAESFPKSPGSSQEWFRVQTAGHGSK